MFLILSVIESNLDNLEISKLSGNEYKYNGKYKFQHKYKFKEEEKEQEK